MGRFLNMDEDVMFHKLSIRCRANVLRTGHLGTLSIPACDEPTVSSRGSHYLVYGCHGRAVSAADFHWTPRS